MSDYTPKSQEAALLGQLQSELGETPTTITSLTEAAHAAGKVIRFNFVEISELEQLEETKRKQQERGEFADSGLLEAIYDSDFCVKDDDSGKVEEIDLYEIQFSGQTFAKDEEGEEDDLDYENHEIVSIDDKEMIFMAGGDWQMPSYVKLGVTKGGWLKVIDCISTADDENHPYTKMGTLSESQVVEIINNRPNA